MTVKFVLSPHLIREDKRDVVEIWENGVMIAALYGKENGFILLASKFGFEFHEGNLPYPHLEIEIGGRRK
jgi:hypothetical protein